MHSQRVGVVVGYLSESQAATVTRAFANVGLESFQSPDAVSFFLGGDLDRCGCVVAALPSTPSDVRRFTHSLTDRQSPLKIVWLTEHPDVSAIVEAVRCGATDVLETPVAEPAFQMVLERACRESMEQQAHIAAKVSAREKLARLSDGEREVLELMLAGKVNKSVASRLNIALRTVENRRKQIFTKLGTRSLAEIVYFVRLVHGAAADLAPITVSTSPPRESHGWDRAAG